MLKPELKKKLGVAAGIGLMVAAVSYGLGKPSAPDFTDYEAGPERKQAFFSYFLSLVEKRNEEIRATREQLQDWSEDPGSIGWWDRGEVEDLAQAYRIDEFDFESEEDWDVLLRRVDTIPPSLALAQAAKESGWGTSRFAVEGNNFYGQWCFEEGCGLVPEGRDSGKAHEVATFSSPEDSVRGYIRNINRHEAYTNLRILRQNLRDENAPVTGVKLAEGLGSYSERGAEYIKEIRSMITFNKLTEYDQAQKP